MASSIASPRRHNKIYRTPRTPPAEVQYEKERSFVLDCTAVSNISTDYSSAMPKLGSAIPPYDSRRDYHVDSYFKFFGINSTLKKTGQLDAPESIAGRAYDRFDRTGHGFRYLSRRNRIGSGHSIEQVRGHELFLSDPKPVVNYNGRFGYRRNTPAVRKNPSIGVEQGFGNTYRTQGQFGSSGCGKQLTFHCQCEFDKPCRCYNQHKPCPCINAELA